MFSDFFLGMQQDLKIFLLPPLICAMFRLIFILVYLHSGLSAEEVTRWRVAEVADLLPVRIPVGHGLQCLCIPCAAAPCFSAGGVYPCVLCHR